MREFEQGLLRIPVPIFPFEIYSNIGDLGPGSLFSPQDDPALSSQTLKRLSQVVVFAYLES